MEANCILGVVARWDSSASRDWRIYPKIKTGIRTSQLVSASTAFSIASATWPAAMGTPLL
jgi:hypothetical protein